MVPSQSAPRSILSRLTAAATATLLLTVMLSGTACSRKRAAQAKAEEFIGVPERIGRLEHPRLRESSGLAASRAYPGVYWTCNDSGNPSELFAVDAGGVSVGVARISAARNVDWEALAIDGQGRIYIADVGNNPPCPRSQLSIYVVSEPNPAGRVRPTVVKEIRFRYPAEAGRFDCEAMFVHGQYVYLLTKELEKARLFRVPLDRPETSVPKAEYLGDLPDVSVATDADLSPNGRRLAVLSYAAVFVYDLPHAPAKVFSPRQAGPATDISPQKRFINLNLAEGICWQTGENPQALMITNEGREVYRVAVAGPRKKKNRTTTCFPAT